MIKVAKIMYLHVYQLTRDNEDSSRDVAQFLEVLPLINTLSLGVLSTTPTRQETFDLEDKFYSKLELFSTLIHPLHCCLHYFIIKNFLKY